MSRKKIGIIGLILLVSTITSCETVRDYQKMYLNDKDMDFSGSKLESFETNWENYREGVSGGKGSKSGGGCGCN